MPGARLDGPDGELIPLDKQDRTLWDRNAISEGVALVTDTFSRGSIGAYQLQAAIAAVHNEATRPQDTTGRRSGVVRLAQAHDRQSDGDAITQSRGDGARPSTDSSC